MARHNKADLISDGSINVWKDSGLAHEVKQTTDTQPRFKIWAADGKHEWGPGGVTVTDTTLFRNAAAELKTDGKMLATNIPTLIKKPSDQDVTNNATRQNDSVLTFAVTAGDLLRVEFAIIYSGNNATGDYKWAFTLPVNTIASGEGWHFSTADVGSAYNSSTAATGGTLWPTSEQSSGTDAAFTTRLLQGRFTALIKTTGSITYTFANVSAAAGRTSRTHAGSVISYVKLNA